jgi:hypothetical protein
LVLAIAVSGDKAGQQNLLQQKAGLLGLWHLEAQLVVTALAQTLGAAVLVVVAFTAERNLAELCSGHTTAILAERHQAATLALVVVPQQRRVD